MIRWIPYTFLRITFFFIAGILVAVYFPDIIPLKLAAFLVLTLLLVYGALFAIRQMRQLPLVFLSVTSFSLIFLAGYVHLLYQTDNRFNEHLSNIEEDIWFYEVTVTGYSQEKEKSWKVVGEISSVKTQVWKPASGNVLLYFRKSDFEKPFRYGDRLLVQGAPQPVPSPANPGEFDYKRFLTFRNIYHQHFLQKSDILLIGNAPPSLFKYYSIEARNWSSDVIHRFISGEREQAIAVALVLGITDALDNELLNAYAATGAMHVLAVSGLHITIIYMIILWLFSPLQKVRHGKWIVAALSLLILWVYAFVTGLSPSVLRAVTMFTFIVVAKATSRSTNIYNTLAASAFCLLLFDPYLIMSVGFQLSYIAVLGIVYIYPYLYKVWEFDTWLGDKVWSITCVSIAAQLATFALGLLYFHQFPNYFLLSNLLVIPLSFGVLVLGLLLLAVSWIGLVAKSVGFLLVLNIKLMNFSVIAVEWLPFSLVENIYISTLQCWMLMLAIVFGLLMFQFRSYRYFLVACSFFVVFTALQWSHFFERRGQSKLAIYKVPGHTAIDFFTESKVYFMTDSSLYNNADKIRFHIRPNRLLSGVDNIYTGGDFDFVVGMNGGKLMNWRNRKLLYISDKSFHLPPGCKPNVLVIANNAVDDLTILSALDEAIIVFDSSNSFAYTKRKLDEAGSLKLSVHSVLTDGAFEMAL